MARNRELATRRGVLDRVFCPDDDAPQSLVRAPSWTWQAGCGALVSNSTRQLSATMQLRKRSFAMALDFAGWRPNA
jgi:hypothetical protein